MGSAFAAHSGPATSYISANFNNAGSAADAVISNWLISPELSLNNGDTLTFWTRSTTSGLNADRLQVRLSTAGSSTHVGSTPHEVGFFGTRLLEINETLQPAGYPSVWTQYTITLSGLSGGETGRFAFLYYVTNAGPAGANSDYIGIDTVSYASNANAIELAAFDAQATGDTVRLTWETASEINSAGFNLYRAAAADGSGRLALNAQLIAAQGAHGLGAAYAFDDAGVPAGTWYYWLEEIETSGAATLHGPVSAEVRVPTAVTLRGAAARAERPAVALVALVLLGLTTKVVTTNVRRND